jgi:hypothetical protein
MLSACAGGTGHEFPTGRFLDVADDAVAWEVYDDGTYYYFFENLQVPEVAGLVTVAGDRITFGGGRERELRSNPSCRFPTPPATYEWSFDGEALTLDLVGEDSCAARREAMDGHTFVGTSSTSLPPAGVLPGEPVRAESSLYGVWFLQRDYLLLHPDGHWGLSDRAWNVAASPIAWGGFTFDDGTLSMATDDAAYCGGTTGEYRAATSISGDEIGFVLVDDPCGYRVRNLAAGPHTRAPRSLLPAALKQELAGP